MLQFAEGGEARANDIRFPLAASVAVGPKLPKLKPEDAEQDANPHP